MTQTYDPTAPSAPLKIVEFTLVPALTIKIRYSKDSPFIVRKTPMGPTFKLFELKFQLIEPKEDALKHIKSMYEPNV